MDLQIVGKLTIEIQSQVSENAPGFMTAIQCCEEQTSPCDVLAKRFPCNMEKYFAWRKKMTHTNLHKVKSIVPVEGTNECIISYENVDGNLDSVLRAKQAKQAEDTCEEQPLCFDAFAGNYDALIIHAITQVKKAMDELELENKFYGELTCDDILFCFNGRYPKDDVRFIDFKLTMADHEKAAQKASGQDIGSALSNQKCLGLLVKELIDAYPSDRSVEFQQLYVLLQSDEILTRDDVFHHCSMWSEARKMDFLCLMKCKIDKYHYVEAFETEQWKTRFKEEVAVSKRHCLMLGFDPNYNNTFGSFVYFNRDTFSHYHEYDVHDQMKFGPDLKHVLRKFQTFYPSLFVVLVPMMKDKEVWDKFFKETK